MKLSTLRAHPRCASEFVADRVEFVGELLAPGRDRDLAGGLLDNSGVIQVWVVLQKASELQDLLARLLKRRASVVPAVHRLDRAPTQSSNRAGRLDRQLADLVFLVQPALDLRDDVIEILHA